MAQTSKQHRSLITRKDIRSALRLWNQTAKLAQHPLAKLNSVTLRRQKAAYKQAANGDGIALQDLLREAISALRPSEDKPVPYQKRWRAYIVLHDQYIMGFSPGEVTESLGIARSTYNHVQASAIERVADYLREQEQIANENLALNQAATAPFLAPTKPPYPIMGRENLVQQIKEQLFSGQSQSFVGLPGIGKTTLAIALAHDPDIRAHFSDGILWARLGQQPNVAAELGSWATTLKLPVQDFAQLSGIHERCQALHAAIGLRRMLLIVDDAWDSQSALAFRLGGPNCAHLVTTRLPEIAVHFGGSCVIQVPELNEEASQALLLQLAPELIFTETNHTTELVRSTGGLPLALVLIGNYLHARALERQTNHLTTLVENLQTAEKRLHLSQPQSPLTYNPSLAFDTPLSLMAAIQVSDQAMTHELRQTLRALTVFPAKPNTFSEEMAMQVASVSQELLDSLIKYGLLERAALGRLTIHQVIKDYAQTNLIEALPFERMASCLIGYAEQHENDFDALQRELTNLVAALNITAEHTLFPLLVRGTNILFQFCSVRGLYELALNHLRHVMQVSKERDEPIVEAEMLMNLGRLALHRGSYEEAEAQFRQGLALARHHEHAGLISRALQGLAVTRDHNGDYEQAAQYYKESLSFTRQLADRQREATLLMNLGGLSCDLGQYEVAQDYLQEGLRIATEIEYDGILSPLLLNLGVVAGYLGDLSQEERCYQQALVVAQRLGHQEDIAYLLTNLGGLASDRGAFAEAEEYLQKGLAISREIGHLERISALLRHLGELEISRGNHGQAREYLDEALSLGREIGHRKNIAATLANLGVIFCAQESFSAAEVHLQEALDLARKMGHQWHIADTLTKLADLYLVKQQLRLASGAFEEAQQIADKIGDHKLKAFALYGIGRLEAEQGNYAAATTYGENSLALFEMLEHWKQVEIRQWLSDIKTNTSEKMCSSC